MRVNAWIRSASLVAVVAAAGVACDDGAAPDVDFDPRPVADAMEGMVAATEGLGDALASLAAADALFEGTATASVLPQAEGLAPEARALRELAEASALGFFPSNYLGVTFVWDALEGRYVPGEAAGAPEDGIRIVYYAVDPVTEQPASPLNALGYVDLRDLSTPASDRLGVMIVRGGDTPVTLADYYVDIAYSTTETQFSVDVSSVGYLSNGTDQLNFDLSQGVDLTETEMVLTQDYSMGLEGTDIGVAYQAMLSADPQTETGTLAATATITNGAETVTLELTADENTLDGVVRYQGVEVAYIGGTFDAPTFTDRHGEPLSQEDMQALADLWQAVGALFELAEGIFQVAP